MWVYFFIFWVLLNGGTSLPATDALQDEFIKSPIPGQILRIYASANEFVHKGQKILCIQVMKMEHDMLAPHSGYVQLEATLDSFIESEQALFKILPAPARETSPTPCPTLPSPPTLSTPQPLGSSPSASRSPVSQRVIVRTHIFDTQYFLRLTHWSHSRESGNLGDLCHTKIFRILALKNLFISLSPWVPAFAGMTPLKGIHPVKNMCTHDSPQWERIFYDYLNPSLFCLPLPEDQEKLPHSFITEVTAEHFMDEGISLLLTKTFSAYQKPGTYTEFALFSFLMLLLTHALSTVFSPFPLKAKRR